ncbi:MAG: bifunctional metallophosphatase/5'-nucleotidase [Myxococcales bacterium]
MLALALVLGLSLAPAPRCVEIVETSDLHGHLVPDRDEIGRRQGGLSWLGGYLRLLRRGANPVLLLDAGDLFQGTLASNLSHGRAVIAGYGALHVDAAVLGNHEFDFGAEAPDRDLLSALRHRVAEASFPFLGANVAERATGALPPWKGLSASRLFVEGGLRVGVIGIANPETPSLTLRRNVASLEFRDAAPIVVAQAAELRAQGAQLVVLLAHEGGRCDALGGRSGEASCEDGQLRRLLHELPKGTVDVALGGHTHQLVANWIASVPALEAGYGGHHFGWLTACAKPSGGLDPDRSVLRPPVPVLPGGSFLGERVAEDEGVARAVAPYLEQVAAAGERRVGPVLPAPLVRDYNALSPLGAVAAEALRRYARADAALVNAGGLRADLPKGPLTYGALYQALPFENVAVVVTLDGAKLLELLGAIARSGHGYPQVAGLALEGPPGHWTGAVFSDGRRLDPARTYRLATVDFLAAGGDGLKDAMASLPRSAVRRLDGAPVLREIVLGYLARSGR